MALMWPTCLRNLFYSLSFLSFENSFIYNKFKKEDRERYDPVSNYFYDHGYESRVFTYNVIETLLVGAAFIALIPVFLFLAKLATK